MLVCVCVCKIWFSDHFIDTLKPVERNHAPFNRHFVPNAINFFYVALKLKQQIRFFMLWILKGLGNVVVRMTSNLKKETNSLHSWNPRECLVWFSDSGIMANTLFKWCEYWWFVRMWCEYLQNVSNKMWSASDKMETYDIRKVVVYLWYISFVLILFQKFGKEMQIFVRKLYY